MKEEIDKLVGGINGKFGTIGWTPIVYRYRFLPHDQLLRLFAVSDVALVTPLRDGMNLIAKEYVASRADRRGVLILSEMAGAARELGEALIINPNDQSEIVDALTAALEMPEDEQMRRNEVMQTRLERYDVIRWGQDFVDELRSVKEQQDRYSARLLDKSTRERLIKDYVSCEKRILLLDYDGTLSPFKERPETAVPGAILVAILNTLSEDPRNNLVIISGRHKALLEKWFGSLNIGIVAEHGAWIREKGTAAKLLLSQENFDFVLAVGDDQADEDLFKVLPEKSFSIKVGLAKSYAKYNLRNHRDVVQLLTDLTKTMKSLESTS